VSEQLALLPRYLTAHLQLSLMALFLGVGISVPLGVLVANIRALEQPVLGLASVIQTIPSLALLAVMVPLLGALDLQSIGFLPAFVGLVLYSMLPILRNTVTGLAGVDPAYREAARGVGMTLAQQLMRVELPLALPTIIAGIRTASVWTVGTATLSTPVGAPSLGNYIFSGLQTRNSNAVLLGCVAAAGLALLLDGLIRLLAAGWEKRSKPLLGAALGLISALYLYTGVTLARDASGHDRGRVVIGAKTFTEQYILADIMAGRLARATALSVETVPSLGSTVAFDALRGGDIDVYVDYSGTIWATVMKRETEASDRAGVLQAVESYLAETHGITVAAALGFENTYALAMRRGDAERLGIRSISDLAAHAAKLSMGGDYEFFGRAEWRALQSRYGLEFAQRRSMDPSLMYQAVQQATVDVVSAFSTDGRIEAFDLVVLEDDRHAIPPYDALILVGARLAREEPEAVAALASLAGTIDADAMRRMNLGVDRDGRSPSEVAARFLGGLRVRDP